MTGLRIEIDTQSLVHQTWKELPLWRRVVIRLIPGISRESVEAEAVRSMTRREEPK